MPDAEKVLELLKNTALEAGELALGMQDSLEINFKGDKSVVTSADIAVSDLIAERTEQLWSQDHWALIDEERPDQAIDPETAFSKPTSLIAVDPIDGTRPYANKLPWYGISIGAIKNAYPWVGVVYFPSLREIFYASPEGAWFEKIGGEKKPITAFEMELGKDNLFYGSEGFTKHLRWTSQGASMVIAGSAVVNLCFPSVGRGIGSVFKAHLWDFAASWSILKNAGLDLFSVGSREKIGPLEASNFNCKGTHPWLLKKPWICCREAHVQELAGGIKRL